MGLFSRSSSSRSSRDFARPGSNHRSSVTSATSSLKSPGPSITTFSSTTTTSPRYPTASTPTSRRFPNVVMPKAPDPKVSPAAYLRSIGAVRERCSLVLAKAKKNELNHFDVDMSKFEDTSKFVVSIIKRDFAPDYASIPPHGRWQHFNVGGKDRVGDLLASWPSSVDSLERTRRILDLFLVSVLLDAGAGTEWSYQSQENGKIYRRSEGLAVASLEMFKTGAFSSDPNQPHQADAGGLKKLTVEMMAEGMQVSDKNPMAGLEGRSHLLIRLGEALDNKEFFGDSARPGNMLDYLVAHPSTHASSVPIVPLPTLWTVLMDGLAPVWPASRTVIGPTSLGDAWPLSLMSDLPPTSPITPGQHNSWELIVPFHKLTQWLCYSLMQPMTKLMNIQFAGAELMTGLPEYRNGGLFIDTGVLTLKEADSKRGIERFKAEAPRKVEVVPMFEPSDDVVVEWRAVTVGFLDELLISVNDRLGLRGDDALSLVQMLEAGSWKGGREIAEVSRPSTKEPPIMILSDGTVF